MQTAIVDFFGVTVVATDPRELAELLVKTWFGPEAKISESNRGWNGYKHRLDIEGVGIVAYGGNADTLHIEVTGSGCVMVKDWQLVADTIAHLEGRLTRVDVAGDDPTGERYNLEWARAQFHEGGFYGGKGRPPKSHLYDDMGSGEGCTLYVGSRQSGKLFRGYEKGKQLGDPNDPKFRCEVEYRDVHRELPLQMLTNPSAYLAGAYPCLAGWDIEQRPIKTVAHTASAMLEKAVEHGRKQAGRVIHALLALNGGDMEDCLARLHVPELPKRLAGHIKAFLAFDESERTHTTATAPAWAAKATRDELHDLEQAYRLPRAVWREGQGINGKRADASPLHAELEARHRTAVRDEEIGISQPSAALVALLAA